MRHPHLLPSLVSLTLAAGVAAQVARFGTPCAAGGALPWGGRIPAISADAMPEAGTSFRLAVTSRYPRSPVLLFLGASDAWWQGRPLPWDMASLGLAGCALLVSPDVTVAATTDAQGVASLSVPLGAGTARIKVFAQAFATGRNVFDQPVFGISDGLSLEVAAPAPEHTIVALPDTQYYCYHASLAPTFTAQANWILANLTALDISFVTHVGDIVESGAQGTNRNQTEWSRALASLGLLDGRVPYGVCLGNHDYDVVNDKSNASVYLQGFGPARYGKYPWYAGASADGTSHAQLVRYGSRELLHLALHWRADDEAIRWAQEQLTRWSRLPAVVTTHEYLRPGSPAVRNGAGHTPASGGDNSGEDIFYKLVEPFPQVCFVTCGHIGGEGQLVSRTVLGRTVNQTLADYQFDPNGGNGWLRLMRFRPSLDRIDVATVSPVYVKDVTAGPDYSSGASSHFTLAYGEREHRGYLGAHRVLRLREGQDFGFGVYSGTEDTQVAAASPMPLGNAPDVFVEVDGDAPQGLLRFDGFLGSARGQVPHRARIVQAILTLTTEGADAQSEDGGRLHRMTADWSEASTWDSLGAGVQIQQETLDFADADTRGQVTATGTRSFDVTQAVQDWVDGTLVNRGWLIQANGGDGWGIRSSEWGTVVERPMLTIVY